MTGIHRKIPGIYMAILADATVGVESCLHHTVRRAVVRFQRQRVKILVNEVLVGTLELHFHINDVILI